MAFLLERGERCQMCGTAQWEWDPKLGGKKHAYEPVAVECQGCKAREVAQEENERKPGVRIELRPAGTPESARRTLLRRRREKRRREERARGEV